jgi:hypothetical protein
MITTEKKFKEETENARERYEGKCERKVQGKM